MKRFKNIYVNIVLAVMVFTLISACENDDFDGLTDTRVSDVEISFPGADNSTNPMYKFSGVEATPVKNVPVDVKITSKSGKIAQTVWVDPLYDGCSGFANFSFSSVINSGTEVLSGKSAIDAWVDEGSNFGDEIDVSSSGSESTFSYNFDVDAFSVFWLGSPGLIGSGGCAAENHRIRFVVLFTDGSVDVSQELRFRFLK